ncbi:hypothetical protein PROH_20860 [Prochlorothrix hollandica PCC 9006 = CALU 1027]|uniref:Uncharacterized protein n=1 Tax=Prochlorothrix hollandica PCC 9006 = CALU 1027 TaxID=317619 RepID=A0A0M2PTZ3_PROHO|nr:hypothetical protein PROH_20860 [Prochlorothrix hollandica PCC 9006 = CALU 1027]
MGIEPGGGGFKENLRATVYTSLEVLLILCYDPQVRPTPSPSQEGNKIAVPPELGHWGAKIRIAGFRSIDGYAVNGYAVNGYAVNGYAVNGYAVDGYTVATRGGTRSHCSLLDLGRRQ